MDKRCCALKSIEELYFEFDLNGYVILRGVLDPEHICRLQQYWSEHLEKDPLHDVNLDWGDEWRQLVDPEPVFRFLTAVFRGRFRMDHMFCASERFVSSAGNLHHHADMFDEGIYYWVRNGRVHAGLIGVQYALTDNGLSQNHFCCIPGSHRANFPVPDACRRLEDNELLRHVPLDAGDALVFSEALVHGTYAVAGSCQRRAVFARYMNNHSYFRRPPEHTALTILPATPNHSEAPSSPFDASLLTERQRRLVAEPAYARGHEPLGVAP